MWWQWAGPVAQSGRGLAVTGRGLWVMEVLISPR